MKSDQRNALYESLGRRLPCVRIFVCVQADLAGPEGVEARASDEAQRRREACESFRYERRIDPRFVTGASKPREELTWTPPQPRRGHVNSEHERFESVVIRHGRSRRVASLRRVLRLARERNPARQRL